MTTGAIILLAVFFVTLFLNVPIALCLGFSSAYHGYPSCGYHADHVRQYK